MLLADTGHEWVQARLLGGVEHLDRTGSRNNHTAIGEADPLVAILDK